MAGFSSRNAQRLRHPTLFATRVVNEAEVARFIDLRRVSACEDNSKESRSVTLFRLAAERPYLNVLKSDHFSKIGLDGSVIMLSYVGSSVSSSLELAYSLARVAQDGIQLKKALGVDNPKVRI